MIGNSSPSSHATVNSRPSTISSMTMRVSPSIAFSAAGSNCSGTSTRDTPTELPLWFGLTNRG